MHADRAFAGARPALDFLRDGGGGAVMRWLCAPLAVLAVVVIVFGGTPAPQVVVQGESLPPHRPPWRSSIHLGLTGYRALDSSYTLRCRDAIFYKNFSFAQFGQDLILYHNFFAHLTRPGFYLDLGTQEYLACIWMTAVLGSNDAVEWSNSLFFDKCLGWQGVCVEPNPAYHQGYLFDGCINLRPTDVPLRQLRTPVVQVNQGVPK